jgi:23S rRNA (guanosine2251-2'-O)-methyltransferase
MSRRQLQYHLIYGEHAVISVLEGGMREIFNVYIAPDKLHGLSAKIRDRYADRIISVDKKFLDKLTRCEHKHQGFAVKAGDLKERGDIIETIASLSETQDRIYGIALDRIQDPHNVGAIIRSAVCFNIDFMALCKHEAPAINNTIVRTSAGCSEKISIHTFNNLNHLIRHLRHYDFCIIGLDSNTDSTTTPKDIGLHFKRALFILGSEGHGLNRALRKNCDVLMHIQMNKQLDSLNVSNAAAIVAYETFLSRQLS